jgi:hypothetical protein
MPPVCGQGLWTLESGISRYRGFVFITAVPITKLFAGGGGGGTMEDEVIR